MITASSTGPQSAWISNFDEPFTNQIASVRLFCFPYAGQGPSVYRTWRSHSNNSDFIKVSGVHLPGRESRIRIPPCKSLGELFPLLDAHFRPELEDQTFAFFGHSMGALIAYEYTRHLKQSEGPEPVHLFLSARRAPHLPERFEQIHKLSDRDFMQKLVDYGATPPSLFENQELLDIFLPILRADFSVCENYQFTEAPLINTPITVFAGESDDFVSEAEGQAWRNLTSGPFSYHSFPAGHFFLHDYKDEMREIMAGELSKSRSTCMRS